MIDRMRSLLEKAAPLLVLDHFSHEPQCAYLRDRSPCDCVNRFGQEEAREMSAEDLETVRAALDALGVALTGHDHQWSAEERAGYEAATRILSP